VAEVSLRRLRRTEAAAVRRLVQLYIYDLGGDRWGVGADGSFGSRAWHRRFWMRRERHHFVIRVAGRLAGFALVRERAEFAGASAREISEFFVLRAYRGRGVGTRVARALLARFPGRWEIAELTWNVRARRFWRRVIRRCAVGRVEERRHRHGDLAFFVQHFETVAPTRRGPPRSRSVARGPSRA
jgi:predicted acetyltransferase